MNGPVPTGWVSSAGSASAAASHVGEAMNPAWAVRKYGKRHHEMGWAGSPFLPVAMVNV